MKKAMKRLHRVQMLLGTQALAESPAKKPPAKAEQTRASGLSNAARKRLSVAAKKRWAVAKRNDMSTLAKPSRKIA